MGSGMWPNIEPCVRAGTDHVFLKANKRQRGGFIILYSKDKAKLRKRIVKLDEPCAEQPLS